MGGYINAKGDMVIEAKFDDAEDFYSNGMANVKINGKLFYINEKGDVLVYIDEITGHKIIRNAQDEVIWSEE